MSHPISSDLNAAFAADAPSEQDVFLKGVQLRPGVTADIHVHVVHDPRAGRDAIVAVHGANTTASGLVGLGKRLLASPGGHAGALVRRDRSPRPWQEQPAGGRALR